MENRTQLVGRNGGGGSSSSSTSFDQLFGSMDSSSSSSSTTGLFGSIFPPPSSVPSHRKQDVANQVESAKYGIPDSNKGESSSKNGKHKSSSIYQTETVEPSYFSSSIYYGGQENYSPRKNTAESRQPFKKDEEKDPNGSSPNSASRGNWWQGSLYY